MNRSSKRLLGAGIASFFLFLLINLPARLVLPLLADSPADMTGLSGTVWRGGANKFSVDQLQFDNARWSWIAGGLLAGRMEFDFRAGRPGRQIAGRFALSPNGHIHARNTQFDISLTEFGAMPFETQAGISINIASLSMTGEWPQQATGTMSLSDLVMRVPDELALGDFNATFNIDDGGPLQADFFDLDGPLEIDGKLSLDARGNYQVNGIIRPRGRLSQRLLNILSFMPRKDGAYELNFAGSL